MHTKLVRTPAIYVVGFMGSGKSTVGAALADELGWDFTDLDHEIEKEARASISEIFAEQGEPEFRRVENEVLHRLIRNIQFGRPCVMAIGGGTFVQRNNFELLEDNGVSIWLDATLEQIRERIAGHTHRPLAQDPVEFEKLFHARQENYARADFRIETPGNDAAETVRRILALPLF